MTENWRYLLLDNINFWVPNFSIFADHIEDKMNTLGLVDYHPHKSRIFSFIDCTTFEISKPNDPVTQRAMYSGHKKIHAIKFQIVGLPNGMQFHVSLPDSARRHDSFLLSQSKILQTLNQIQEGAEEENKFRMHGDPAYANHLYLSGGDLGEIRVVIEQDIGEAKEFYKLVNYERLLQIKKTKVSLICFMILVLHDIYVCLNGSKVGRYFNLAAPSLEEWTIQGPKKVALESGEDDNDDDFIDLEN